MDDGWRFAESLLGVAAEALKARREAEARADAAENDVPEFTTPEEAAKGMAELSGVNSVVRGMSKAPALGLEDGRCDYRAHGGESRCIDPKGHAGQHHLFWDMTRGPTPPAHSVEERRIRAEVAASINAALGYGAQNPDLEESLAVLQNKIQFGALSGSAAALVQSKVRDAALEEAATVFDERSGTSRDPSGARHSAAVIRALKSKPATEKPPIYEAMAYGTQTQSDAAAKEYADPVHDFGWALQQMRAGKKVRRAQWDREDYAGCWWLVKAADGTYWWRSSTSFGAGAGMLPAEILATDWQVVDV